MTSDVHKNTKAPAVTAAMSGDASVSSSGTQTRFSFYNADDYVQRSPQNPHRFNFYNAEEVHRANPKTNLETPVISNKEMGSDDMDSADILRSLQEHEQQRLEILARPKTPSIRTDSAVPSSAANSTASNPYEDAIKEALHLLRKHRATPSPRMTPVAGHGLSPLDTSSSPVPQFMQRTPPEADRLLQSRGEATTPSEAGSALGEAYQAEIEARRKQRQERMARYASRLAELKQESEMDNALAGGETSEAARSAAWDDANNETRESSSTFSAREVEVQRGVEKVLMAILERANSQGRAQPPLNGPLRLQSTRGGGGENGHSEETKSNDALLRAMSDLLGSSSFDSLDRPGARAVAERGSLLLAPIESAEEQHVKLDYSLSSVTHEHSVDRVSVSISNLTETPNGVKDDLGRTYSEQDSEAPSLVARSSSEEQDHLDSIVQKVLMNEDAASEKYNDDEASSQDSESSLDRRVRQVISNEADDIRSSSEENDSYDDDETTENSFDDSLEDDEHDSSRRDDESENGSNFLSGVLGPLSKKAGGTTGVVLENSPTGESNPTSPSLLESFSAAMNMVTGVRTGDDRPIRDKYSADNVDYEDQESDSDSGSESLALMKTLCAHLLPENVPNGSRLLDPVSTWDDSNPDEPGYRIIRLTREQLRRVEREYAKYQRDKQAAGSDECFERDLKAAEKLLDREERKQRAAAKAKALLDSDNATGYEMNGLEHFPGVKPAGKGEMGDLEFFQLPIIFKSNVTGFEPTKDLYLEAGNVVAGQYLVESELGSAAFSTAYRCIDLSSDGDGPDGHEEVCLKVIKNTKDFFDQSLDEIKILELLRQTGKCEEMNIVEMKTFFYHREHLIIVTELLRQNLFEFGKFIIDNDEEPYFTLPRLAYITRQCLVALKFVHNLGLVHSDVKPENILLGSYSRARIKLIDFGSSCYLTDRQSSYIQSRSYRAPEVVLGLPYDGRIDIWSLGCVVAEMFTGEVTFQNDSIVSMLSRIEAICGVFPRHMIEQGRQSKRFFTKCGLLFEKASLHDESQRDGSYSDESSTERTDTSVHIDVFQPKKTSLSARLGFACDLMERYDEGKKLAREEKRQAVFVDFVRKLLSVDPEDRPTAGEALDHPWMIYAATLTEDDIKYPSS